MVCGTVQEILNTLLDAEVDRLCQARRYERTAARTDTRAGYYTRKLHTRAEEVKLKMPKLRPSTFETAIIERYRRRSVRRGRGGDADGAAFGRGKRLRQNRSAG